MEKFRFETNELQNQLQQERQRNIIETNELIIELQQERQISKRFQSEIQKEKQRSEKIKNDLTIVTHNFQNVKKKLEKHIKINILNDSDSNSDHVDSSESSNECI